MPTLPTLNGPAEFPQYRYRARLVRIIDADTIRVSVDLGMRISREVNLRIADIDAPEVYGRDASEAGRTATEALREMLGDRPLYVATRKDTTSFDRYVAALYIDAGDGTLRDIGAALVEGGHAVVSEG